MSSGARIPWRLRLAAAFVLLLACDDDNGEVERMAKVVEPHVAPFMRFEHWVQRANGGLFDPRERAAIGETMFAPIRHDEDVLAALVVREQRRELRWVFPPEATFPHPINWIRVRQAPHGTFDVATWADCPLELPTWWRKGVSRHCVLVSHKAQLSVGDSLTVVVAFTEGP